MNPFTLASISGCLVCVVACGSADSNGPDLANSGAVSDFGADASANACMHYALKHAWFGDLHAHTSYSLDAYSFGTRNDPLDAFAFARGLKQLPIASAMPDGSTGPTVGITRPLDFLAVTDHSEWLTATQGCVYDPSSVYYDAAWCKNLRSAIPSEWMAAWNAKVDMMGSLCPSGRELNGQCLPEFQTAWQKIQAAAAVANDPCNFTAFVGFEWTYSVGGTLHKNVIFRSDSVPSTPLDSAEYPSQLALWNGLETLCRGDAGCEALTIPHNSNLSNGLAFQIPDGGEALANKYQKLVEVMQHKGSSECYHSFDPDAGAQDGECNFEYAGDRAGNGNLPTSYIRRGLLEGLVRQALAQTNPLVLGFIAATDDHNGTPGNVNEGTWPGHEARYDDTPAARLAPNALEDRLYKNPGGLAVVWAEENTRDSIFSAFQRRETYATSGTRIQVRFYQTWNDTDYCSDSMFPSTIVAAGGVPMGGAFGPQTSASGGPRFVVRAWKDLNDLARVDIVKLWVDGTGTPHTKIFPQVLPAAGGCVPWQDPAYSSTEAALYYARVLEVPSPRWSSYDCTQDNTTTPFACADGGVMNAPIQERAWTSPIWFKP